MKRLRILSVLVALALLLAMLPAELMTASAAETPQYYITVDLTNQIVTCYRIADDVIVRQMLCSAGLNDATVCGTFKMPKGETKWDRTPWYFFTGFRCYAKYPTRVYKGILFHSITYNKQAEDQMSKKAIGEYGYAASHGCMRLLVKDAQWIQEHCPIGTEVTIYKSGVKDEALRKLLFQEGYSIDDGISYNEYWGLPNEEGAVGRYSSKEEISALQTRLYQLGYYTAEIDGRFNTDTSTALLRAQYDSGSDQTGYVDGEFSKLIYSQDAPATIGYDLSLGMHGPVVRLLQKNLTTLGLYTGALDGIYDQEVADAVSKFQNIYGYKQDGNAPVIQQEAISYEAGQVTQRCGTGATAQVISEDIAAVKVDTAGKANNIRLRAKEDANSAVVGAVTNGSQLLLLQEGDTWTQVQSGSTIGYIMTKYVVRDDYHVYHLECTGNDGTVYSIGCTMADLKNGVPQPNEAFETTYKQLLEQRKEEQKLLEAAQDTAAQLGGNTTEAAAEDTQADTNVTARVETGSDDVRLNLRQSPDTGAEILQELSNGSEVTILLTNGDWAYVSYEGTEGYVLRDYLTTDLDGAEGAEPSLNGAPAASVVYTTEGFAYVYQDADKKSEKIDFVTTGTEVASYGDKDGFTLIRYGDGYANSGYVKTDMLAAVGSVNVSGDAAKEETQNQKGAKFTAFAYVLDSVAIANVYDSDAANASIIGTLPAGTKVTVMAAPEDSDYALIKYKGNQGYMKNSDLRFDVLKA